MRWTLAKSSFNLSRSSATPCASTAAKAAGATFESLNVVRRRFSSMLETITPYQSPNASAPLLEHYRSSWPDANIDRAEEEAVVEQLPPRTVPDKCLRFEYTAVFRTGEELYYKHLPVNPENFKVKMRVFLYDLQLEDEEKCILLRMVGPRYNVGKQEITFTAKKFPSRLENKKYLVLLLERLLAESRRLSSIREQFEADVAASAAAEAAGEATESL